MDNQQQHIYVQIYICIFIWIKNVLSVGYKNKNQPPSHQLIVHAVIASALILIFYVVSNCCYSKRWSQRSSKEKEKKKERNSQKHVIPNADHPCIRV